MDLTGTQIKNTYGNVITIGAAAGTPQTGTLQNGAGENITSATLTGGTVTTSNPLLDMTQTWNDGGVTFTSLKLNVTDTASGASSLLLDLQVGGSSKFSVDKDGAATIAGKLNERALIVGTTTNTLGISVQNFGSEKIQLNGYHIIASSGLSISWGNSTTQASAGTIDLSLFRDAAGVLAQRRSTNAQTFNIYNTYTDASNYEGAALKWDSNTFKIGAFSLGTGTTREVAIVLPNGQQVAFGSAAVRIPAGCNLNRVSSGQQIGLYNAPWEKIFVYESNLVEKSADPSDPAEGQSVMWQSDGTGTGDDGDILIKITAGGLTKTATLVDFSTI